MPATATVRKRIPTPVQPTPAERSEGRLRLRLLLAGVCAGVLLLLIAIGEVARLVAPSSNTGRMHYDVIVVLGTPTNPDGLPTPRQQIRVREAVREYELGAAPRLLFTGGDTRRGHVEADTMAGIAKSLGIPPSQILEERQAQNTIENACYSVDIMRHNGWHSAEVIGSEAQTPRAGLIFSRFPIDFATHAAPASDQGDRLDALREMLKTSRFLLFGRLLEPCMP